MKCVKDSSGKVERVSNGEAEKLVGKGTCKFVPKSEWKKGRQKKD